MQVFSERVPPHSTEAEQSVLGAMLIDREARISARLTVTADDFYAQKHATIYKAICYLQDKGRPVDIQTVADLLKRPIEKGGKHTWIDEIGGIGYLMGLINVVPTTANVRAYAEIVTRKSRLRRLADTGLAIREAAFEADATGDEEAAAKALADSEAAVRGVTVQMQKGGLEPIKGISVRARERLQRVGQPDPKRIQFGLRELDQFAWKLGELVTVHAPSGHMKSRLTRAMAVGAAKRAQGAAYFSLEMGQDSIEEALIAAEGKISLMRLRNMDRSDLTREERLAYEMAADVLDPLPLYFDYLPAQGMQAIRAKCLDAAMRFGDLRVIIVDYAGISGDRPDSKERHEQMLIRIHYELQWLCREIGALGVMIDQAPKQMTMRADPTPTDMDFRDAQGISQAVDHAVGLLVPSQCKKSGNGRSMITPTIQTPRKDLDLPFDDSRWRNTLLAVYTKGRMTGPGWMMPLYADGPSGRIGNLARRPWDLEEGHSPYEGNASPVTERPRMEQPKWNMEPQDEF